MFRRIGHIQPSGGILERPFLTKNPTFRSGDIFRGRVIQRSPQGRFLVTARERAFLAQSGLSLKEGQEYLFQVRSVDPRVELKILEFGGIKRGSPAGLWASGRVARAQLAGILGELSVAYKFRDLPPEAKRAYEGLASLLPTVIYRGPGVDDGPWLSRLLLQSGLFWENRITRYFTGHGRGPWKPFLARDLKGMLLMMDASLRSIDVVQDHMDSPAMKVKQALHIIEQDQLFNLSSAREDLGWLWFIPGLEDEGFRKAEVFYIREHGEKEIRFSILLEFIWLGELDVQVYMLGKRINVRIQAEDAEKADYLRAHLPSLASGLQEAGMSPGMITCEIREGQDMETSPSVGVNPQRTSIDVLI
jgi:hypothetical protein